MKKVRQFIINWLFQDNLPFPSREDLTPPSPCQLETEQTVLFTEECYPILDLDRMVMTTFYLRGGPTFSHDSEPTVSHHMPRKE
jgi:hypothetical protein